ncbi:MAG: NusG domain II-containing protein [Oscillospiraceae bacterium]|nr:NusG domain II-containing protein [Oscillospiraceae bacterium]
MKTKHWILLLAGIVVICLGLSIPVLLPGEDAHYAQIISNGQSIRTVDLRIDQTIHVDADNGGHNIITVTDGRIGVTEATCPDHYCIDRGMCSGGVQIVCLPNRLVIRFEGQQMVDSVAG